MRVNIHNQCSDFKLIDRKYLRRAINWYKEPDVEVDAGSMTNAVLISPRAAFEGALTYQLQKEGVESDDQLESTATLLFVAWKFEGYKVLRACVHLIEYGKQITWNEYKLREYHQRYVNQFSTYTGPIEDTWLTRDGTVLMTRLELDFIQRNGVLNITISEGVKDEHTKRSKWISLER
jgi:hypothetical protein